MPIKHRNLILSLILTFSLILLYGGCDIEFNSGDDNNNTGTSEDETVEGNIISTIPDIGVETITAQITNDQNNNTFSDTTSSSGFFRIEGPFADTPELEFFDNSSSLGRVFLNVFPGVTLQLGNIRLENGAVMFDDVFEATFTGVQTANNCSVNTGSIDVEVSNNQATTTIFVQVTNSTNIEESNGDEIDCDQIFDGQELEVIGDLVSVNTVDATFIELKN